MDLDFVVSYSRAMVWTELIWFHPLKIRRDAEIFLSVERRKK